MATEVFSASGIQKLITYRLPHISIIWGPGGHQPGMFSEANLNRIIARGMPSARTNASTGGALSCGADPGDSQRVLVGQRAMPCIHRLGGALFGTVNRRLRCRTAASPSPLRSDSPTQWRPLMRRTLPRTEAGDPAACRATSSFSPPTSATQISPGPMRARARVP
jgi:hypothetical protein